MVDEKGIGFVVRCKEDGTYRTRSYNGRTKKLSGARVFSSRGNAERSRWFDKSFDEVKEVAICIKD